MLQQQLTSCLEKSWITESSFVVVPEKGTSSAPTLTEVAMPSRLRGTTQRAATRRQLHLIAGV